nr:O-antigen ligase family protein [Sphingobium boeckii]
MHIDIAKIHASSQSISRNSGASRSNAIWVTIMLVAASPAIMAAVSWTPDNHYSIWLYWIRFYAPPVLLIEMLAIGLAMTAGFRPFATIADFSRSQAIALGGIVVIASATAVFVAPDPATAVLRGMITSCHLLFGMSIFFLAKINRFAQPRALWAIMALTSFAYCLLMIVYTASIGDPLHYDWLQFGLGVVNIRHTGFYIIPGTAIALGLIAYERRPLFYTAGLVVITTCFALNFWAGSRAPVIALIAACGLTAVLLPELRTARFLTALCLGLVLGAVLSLIHLPPDGNYGVFRIFSSATVEGADISSGRLALWKSSIETFFQHPWFGVGESQFILVVPGANSMFHHPHDAILQILLQWGAIGFGLVAVLAIPLWLKLLATAKSQGSHIVPAFLAINTLLFYSMIDGIAFFIYPMMILTFLIAISLAGESTPLQSARAAP